MTDKVTITVNDFMDSLGKIEGVRFEIRETARLYSMSNRASRGLFICNLEVHPSEDGASWGPTDAVRKLVDQLDQFVTVAKEALNT